MNETITAAADETAYPTPAHTPDANEPDVSAPQDAASPRVAETQVEQPAAEQDSLAPTGDEPPTISASEIDAAAESEIDAAAGNEIDAAAGNEIDAAAESAPEAGGESASEVTTPDAAIDAVIDAPALITFADLGLSEQIVAAVEEMGYRHPTPIQAQAIPFVLMGRDVLGVAQTGTGKTAGFTLPMIDILSGSRARARMPRSLILEPTRELALQVAENFVKYGKNLKLNHALLIGGESMNDQKDVLTRGVDVLIATPGRLIDLFERGGLMLNDTRILVIDETDRMLDMGFIPDVERIVSLLPATRQTLFFSATMAPEIRRLADAFLRNPKEISVSRQASVAPTIVAGLTLVAPDDKREALRRLIRSEDVQNALIFCNRKRDVDILFKSLTKHGFDAGALHGDMSQPARFATLEKFKANELRLLVCSDVAARGIDIGGLSHVFNFDVPHHAEDYVHRIGRTGRAGREGHAYTIAGPEDRAAVEAIEKLVGHPIPLIVVDGLDRVEWAEGDGRRRGRRPASSSRGAEARAPRGRERVATADAADRPERGDTVRRGGRRPARAQAASAEPAAVTTAAIIAVPADAPPLSPREEGPVHSSGRSRGRPDARSEPHPEARPEPRSESRSDSRPDNRNGARSEPRPDIRADERPAPRPASRPAPRSEPRQDARQDPRQERPVRGRPNNDRGNDRGWRQDELGPNVIGFGAEVPAFMTIRRWRGGPAEAVLETEGLDA